MAVAGTIEASIARIYGNALLQAAEGLGEGEELLAELQGLVSYLDRDPAFDAFLSSPLLDAGVRQEVLERVFRGRASDLLVDALQVINRRERLGLLRAVVEAYTAEFKARRGIVEVHVQTAMPLTEGLRERIREVTGRLTGKTPELAERVAPELIGGIVVQVEGEKIDASVASLLQELTDRLLERASREILSGRRYATPTETANDAEASGGDGR